VPQTVRRYRTVQVQADPHIMTAAAPVPDDLRDALDAVNVQG
jgi:hypothetical protein